MDRFYRDVLTLGDEDQAELPPLNKDKGLVGDVSFVTDGCMNTRACSNTVAVLAQGKTIDQAWEITSEHVVEYLKTLPQNEIHCAELAVGAFYRALVNYQGETNRQWKQIYT